MKRHRRLKSAIPVGTQFSPGVVSLPGMLRALTAHGGSRDRLLEAIWAPEVRLKSKQDVPTRRNRSLPLEAAIQYGLVDKDTLEATSLAKRLNGLPERKLYPEFAKHILLNLGGLRVLQGVREMRADGLEITADNLSRHLTSQGFPVSEHNTAINSLRMWLAKAGIFLGASRGANAWEIDEKRVSTLIGLDSSQVDILAGLTLEHRMLVRTLCTLAPGEWIPASRVRDLAETTSGLRYRRDSLPQLLSPLVSAGLIEVLTKGTSGGKTSVLRTTARFQKEHIEPFVEATVQTLDPAAADYLRRRPKDILSALRSRSTAEKGAALEALTIMFMKILGLRFVKWNQRAAQSQDAEVDAVFEGVLGVTPTRWQVQCKNKPNSKVSNHEILREVGLARLTRATHVLVATTGDFSRLAREAASGIFARDGIPVFLLRGSDLEELMKNPSRLGIALRDQARSLLQRSDNATQ